MSRLLGGLRRQRDDDELEARAAWPVPAGSLFDGMPNTSAGQVVTVRTAMRSAAVAGCVRVLKTEVAQLPVDVIRVVGKRRLPVTPQPLVVRQPSSMVSRRGWLAQVVDSMATAGNADLIVTGWDRMGRPQQLEPITAGDISWQRDGGRLRPFLDGQAHDVYPLGDIVHIPFSPYLRAGSPVADSPVELAKQAIGTGLAAEDFGARFFGDGYHPTVLAQSDKELTDVQAGAIKAAINRLRSTREPGVFGSGIKLERWDVNAKDSQFIDLMRFEVEQACRFFGVPPSMVYAAISGQNVTYANVSQADMQFLKHSLGIWLADIEDAWSALLVAPQQVKLNVDALLRMDPAGRHNLYAVRLNNKTITINEVRELEDEAPFDDPAFDDPGVPGGADAKPIDSDQDGIVDPQAGDGDGDGQGGTAAPAEESASVRELAEILQKVYLAVGKVITVDEARALLNRAGAGFDIPSPDFAPPAPANPTGGPTDG